MTVLAVIAQAAGSSVDWAAWAGHGPVAALVIVLAGVGKMYIDRTIVKPNGGSSLRDHIDDLHEKRSEGDRRAHERINSLEKELAALVAAVARIEGKLDNL